jgi:hypothetical protein
MKQRRDEDELQKGVVSLLTLNGYWTVHVPNQGKRSGILAAALIAMGLWPGFPDLLVFAPIPKALTPDFKALLCTIELKRPARKVGKRTLAPPKPKTDQLATHKALRARGVPVLVCASLEDVAAGMAGVGYPLHARVMA